MAGIEDWIVIPIATKRMPIKQQWKQLQKLEKKEELATKHEIVAL